MAGTNVVIIEPEMPVKAEYVAYWGQDFEMKFTWTDEAGVAIDLSAATATYKVAPESPKTFLTPYTIGSSVVSITQATGITMDVNGNITVFVEKATINAITPGLYIHTLTVVRSSVDTNIVVGDWRLRGAVK